MMYSVIQSMRVKIRNLKHDERGVSAIEFALVLPVMLILYLGGVEVSQAVGANRKAVLVARTIGDLVAQTTSITDTELNNIFNASTAVIFPFDKAELSVVVSCISVNDTQQATVTWSEKSASTATTRSGDVTALIPSTLRVPKSAIIWAEAFYNYKPQIGHVITGTIALKERLFFSPRKIATCPTRT